MRKGQRGFMSEVEKPREAEGEGLGAEVAAVLFERRE